MDDRQLFNRSEKENSPSASEKTEENTRKRERTRQIPLYFIPCRLFSTWSPARAWNQRRSRLPNLNIPTDFWGFFSPSPIFPRANFQLTKQPMTQSHFFFFKSPVENTTNTSASPSFCHLTYLSLLSLQRFFSFPFLLLLRLLLD